MLAKHEYGAWLAAEQWLEQNASITDGEEATSMERYENMSFSKSGSSETDDGSFRAAHRHMNFGETGTLPISTIGAIAAPLYV